MRKRESEPLLRDARERLTDGWEHDRENRSEGFLDLKMLAGDQWPVAARLERESAFRPVVTVNGMTQFVHQVANDIRQNPPGIKVVPADGKGDAEVAKIYSGIIRQIEYESGAAEVYAQAGGHAVGCGIGHFRIITDYESDDVFDQTIGIKRMPFPLSVVWDPESTQPDRSDAKFCFVTEMVHERSWPKRFPGTKPSNVDLPLTEHDPENGLFWKNGSMYRIAEYWYRVPVRRKLVMVEGGAVFDVTDWKRDDIGALGLPVIAERAVESWRIEQALISGNEILETPKKWPGRYFPIIPVVGGEIPLETKIVRYGLIRFARDAQQLYNYARTAAAEAIGQAAKAPYLVTPKMIGPYKGLWDTHNLTSRPYLLFDPDERVPGGPQKLAGPEYPQAYVQEASISAEDMKRTTGIYDASLGARSNETSGRAILARERQGDTATAHYNSNLQISMMHAGRVLIDLIPRIYDTERMVTILGEDNTEELVPINRTVLGDNGEPVLLNDLSKGRYAVRVRIGPSYATRRMEAAESMLAFVQAVPQAGAIIGDLIAGNMDWPGADQIAERLKRTIPPQILEENGGANPQQMQQQAIAAQLQELAGKLQIVAEISKIEKTQAVAGKAAADTEATRVETAIKALQALVAGMNPADPAAVQAASEAGNRDGERSQGGFADLLAALPQGGNGFVAMGEAPSMPQPGGAPPPGDLPPEALGMLTGDMAPGFAGMPQ